MNTPLFNYSLQLLNQVAEAGILFSDESILKLNCVKVGHSTEQANALKNFEHWKMIFLENCNGLFYAGSTLMIKVNEERYKTDLLSALLIAELNDWSKFASFEAINTESIFRWVEGALQITRPYSRLIEVVPLR